MAHKLIRWSRRRIIAITATVAVLGGLTMYPLPYFLKVPGSAEPVKNRVFIEGSDWTEKGDFLFTTVLQYEKPSILEYAFVKLTEDYMETVPVRKAIGNVSDVNAYNRLTEWMREDSESSAVIAAFDYLKKPVQVEQTGVIIRSFLQDSPASKLLHEGDVVTGVDGHSIRTAAELAEFLKGKQKGESINLQVLRGEKNIEAAVSLVELDSGRVGIGFIHGQVQRAIPSTPVRFKLEDIGGPSAGLMLCLDIISKLEQKDYTRGRKIAGTGTIEADGSVGQIGGIRYKLVAASREKAEYFFVPKDKEGSDGNQKEAKDFLPALHSSMKLVPVATLKEAADFLNGLPDNP